MVVEGGDAVAGGEGSSPGAAGVGVCAVASMASTNDAIQDSNRIFIMISLRVRWGRSRIWIQKSSGFFGPIRVIKSCAARFAIHYCFPQNCGCSSVVEHLLAKEDVASSSLVTRSSFAWSANRRSLGKGGPLNSKLCGWQRMPKSIVRNTRGRKGQNHVSVAKGSGPMLAERARRDFGSACSRRAGGDFQTGAEEITTRNTVSLKTWIAKIHPRIWRLGRETASRLAETVCAKGEIQAASNRETAACCSFSDKAGS
jgi:hypothetical protein